eukprot:TRINITY_DN3343_c0_g2_i1.p1 TRINITY_DN3343_c0_g2~~TRINITY_DN3343_c0_g2_i1.p1  ORF type:complete len:258 (+),score=55.96 TRINITY_DN3343_c0_g2_i1:205-978(+)
MNSLIALNFTLSLSSPSAPINQLFPLAKPSPHKVETSPSSIMRYNSMFPPLEIAKASVCFYTILSECLKRQNELGEEEARQLLRQITAAYQRLLSKKVRCRNLHSTTVGKNAGRLNRLLEAAAESLSFRTFPQLLAKNPPSYMKDIWWMGAIVYYAAHSRAPKMEVRRDILCICFDLLTGCLSPLNKIQLSFEEFKANPTLSLANYKPNSRVLLVPITASTEILNKNKVIIQEITEKLSPLPQTPFKFTKGICSFHK